MMIIKSVFQIVHLATPEGRMKDAKFQPIIDKFLKKCNDWDGRQMSFAAKEVNVKSVVQALPTYLVSSVPFSMLANYQFD